MLSLYLAMLDTDAQKDKFEQIYTGYYRLMLYEAKKCTGDYGMAEDVAHDVCLHIIKKLDTLRTENRNEMASLIVLITRNKAIDALRRAGRSFATDEDEAFGATSSTDTEDIVLTNLAFEEMYAAIGTLKDTYRIPLTLKAQGYTTKEIATLLSLSEEAVRLRLWRGRKKLQEKLQRGVQT